MARNWNKKYTVAVAITAFVAIILIAAMIIPAMYLLSYADEQWTIGLYFRNHQEYICAIDDEVAEFNFLGINVGKDEENIPSPERSVCYLAGYPASSFVFVDAGDNGRFDSLQLQVYISAPESFTATEVVFETDGVRTAYEIGMAVYDRIDTDDVESTNELLLSFSWYIDTGFDFSCQYSVDLKNNFEEQIAVDTVLLNHPDFENFSYSQASAGESELPVIVESGAAETLTVTYDGGEADSAVILRPALYFTRNGVRYVTHADGANVYYNSMTADYILELIKERNTDK